MAELVAFDFETTGLSPSRHHIIEIGAVRFDVQGRVLDTFSQLCDPGYSISSEIAGITGIRPEELVGAPSPIEGLRAFRAWSGGDDAVLAAHNAGFDTRFLTAAYLDHHESVPNLHVVDTLRWARSLRLPTPDCKLATLLAHYGHDAVGLHRSLADAQGVRCLVTGWLKDVADPRAEVVSRIERARMPAPATSFREY